MIEKTPYIIVDDKKIAPIRRVLKPTRTPAKSADREDKPFGVVDRVTISKAAMEKSRRFQVMNDPKLQAPHSSGKWMAPSTSSLADSSKKHH